MNTDVATDIEQRRWMLRRMAQSCLVLVVVIVVLSAFMRHRAAGLDCDPWPACRGQEQVRKQAGEVVTGDDVALARLVHRAVASLTLVLVVAMVFGGLASGQALRREAIVAVGLLVLALALAVLGAFAAGSRVPAVTVGNVLGGFAMLAMCARMIGPGAAAPGRLRDGALARVAIIAAFLLVLAVALGALVSATHAQPGAPIHLAHRIVAIVAAVAVLALGVLAWRRGRWGSALVLAGLLLGVLALGLAMGGGALSMPLVLLHNLGAAGLLATVARLP